MQQPEYNCNLPRINEPAPMFSASSTHGTVRLTDYAGKWLLLFSHPADFTPVCTSEFIAFARYSPDFAKLNCALLGLSVDSNYAHMAWVLNIKEKFGVDIEFPIIEDVSLKVAQTYGMIMQGASTTAAVRATFLIDPHGIIRAMVYYPLSNGRSVSEFLRLLHALQATDSSYVATPENWMPGEPAIVPPPQTVKEAKEIQASDPTAIAWYYREARIPSAAHQARLPLLPRTDNNG